MASAAPNEAPERLAGLGIQVIDGAPRFTSANAIAVDDRFEIKAKHVIIATGSTTNEPAIDGLNGEVADARERSSISRLPRELAVIGAMPKVLNWRRPFCGSVRGSPSSIPNKPLPEEDAECAAILLQGLQAQGIALRNGAAGAAAKSGDAIELTIDQAGEPETIRSQSCAGRERAGVRRSMISISTMAGLQRMLPESRSTIVCAPAIRKSMPSVRQPDRIRSQAANQHAATRRSATCC